MLAIWVPKGLMEQLRATASAELGAMRSRNGRDAAVPTVVRRLIEAYVAGGKQ